MIASARKVACTPAMSMPTPVHGSWCIVSKSCRSQRNVSRLTEIAMQVSPESLGQA